MIDAIFAGCVLLLQWLAVLLGTTYEVVNVWIFCVIWPIFTIVLIIVVLQQRKRIKTLTRRLKEHLGEV